MKGTLRKDIKGWYVEYYQSAGILVALPLHPDFLEMMDKCFTSTFTQEVEFEIVDEFSHPELYQGVPLWEGKFYAKLIKREHS